jgi:hypothetical protein
LSGAPDLERGSTAGLEKSAMSRKKKDIFDDLISGPLDAVFGGFSKGWRSGSKQRHQSSRPSAPRSSPSRPRRRPDYDYSPSYRTYSYSSGTAPSAPEKISVGSVIGAGIIGAVALGMSGCLVIFVHRMTVPSGTDNPLPFGGGYDDPFWIVGFVVGAIARLLANATQSTRWGVVLLLILAASLLYIARQPSSGARPTPGGQPVNQSVDLNQTTNTPPAPTPAQALSPPFSLPPPLRKADVWRVDGVGFCGGYEDDPFRVTLPKSDDWFDTRIPVIAYQDIFISVVRPPNSSDPNFAVKIGDHVEDAGLCGPPMGGQFRCMTIGIVTSQHYEWRSMEREVVPPEYLETVQLRLTDKYWADADFNVHVCFNINNSSYDSRQEKADPAYYGNFLRRFCNNSALDRFWQMVNAIPLRQRPN